MSRQIKFRYDLLNINEMKKGEVNCTNASVRLDSLTQIKRTATFDLIQNGNLDIDYANDRICPIMMEKINGVWREKALGVYLLPAPVEQLRHKSIIRNIQAYDTSQILMDDKFTEVLFLKKGTNYVKSITQIINSAGIIKVNITDSDAVLTRDREFEIGMTKLAVVNELLTEINYTSIYTDEHGYFVSRPYLIPNLRKVELIYRNDENSQIIEGTMRRELNLIGIPNIWKVTAKNIENGTLSSKYVNEDPTSPTSTVVRKRNIVDVREINDIADQGTLDLFTIRLANEASNQYEKISFETLKNLDHSYSNVLYVAHDVLDIDDKYIETSWSMDLSIEGTMKHEARRVVRI